jgi:hypothetical protein
MINIHVDVIKVKETSMYQVLQQEKSTLYKKLVNVMNEGKMEMDRVLSEGNPTGNLANSIQVEDRLSAEAIIGLGRVHNLPKYWQVINYGVYNDTKIPFIPGRHTTNPNTPKFVPGEFRGGRFQHIPFHHTGIIPKKPITAKNYIEAAVARINNSLQTLK